MGKTITENKKAYHEYEILERFEAGIVLSGLEIKSVRAGKINLQGAHAKVLTKQQKNKETEKPELFLVNANIQTPDKENATRTRKLLMHRAEINKLIGKTQLKGLSLIPLSVYLTRGRAKVALALGRGKKLHDKRETIKKRDLDREMR